MHALYRFFNERGSLLYVGRTARLPQRIWEHRTTKAWWSDVDYMKVEWFPDMPSVSIAERRAIETEGPCWNSQHRTISVSARPVVASEFAATLKQLRGERGLSLRQLADLAHYGKSYLHELETGVKPPTAEVARLLDEALGGRGRLIYIAWKTTERHGGNVTTAAQDIEAFFTGSAPAAKFADREYGTVIGGEIVAEPRMQQQRDYESNEPITYQDGNPAMQMVVIVQTNLHDPSIPDDDGQRTLYIKGQLKQAVGDALKKAGEKAPRRGGKLWVKYVEDRATTLKNGRRGNDQKIYAAKYEPPAQAAAGQFFDEPSATEGRPSADSMRSSGNGVSALPCPPGIDPGKWAAMNSQQREQMYDALGLRVERPPAAARFTEEPPF